MTEGLSESIFSGLTVEGVAFSPDSGVSSCSDSEPSSPVMSRHFTQLTNAKLPGYTDKDDMSPNWQQHQHQQHQQYQQSPCSTLYPCSSPGEPQSCVFLPADDRSWQDATPHYLPSSVPQHTQPSARREWMESKAGIQVCHTGDGNAQVRLQGGLTYDIGMDIDLPNLPPAVIKTEKNPDSSARLSDADNKYLYTDDMNNNNSSSSMFSTYLDDNCNDCYLNRPPGYGHGVTYPYHHDADYQNVRADSPDDRVPARKRQTVTRTERLWEFILRLLGDPTYNPDLIEWADREDGMFRLNNSKSIAHMWGMRKNNVQMTYEKLSRALRYYYHRRILEPVLGKKLVYRFGPNATQVWVNRVYKPQGSR